MTSKPIVAVLVPVLGRESRAKPLVESIRASDPRCDPVFLCSPQDILEIEAIYDVGAMYFTMSWEPGPGDYAKKINYGFKMTRFLGAEWIFLGADDLVFHPGWLDACLRVHEETDACVIGTNDLGNAKVMAGNHATHSLVHRDYFECGTVDEDGVILHEGYDHQNVDNEFVETAQARGTFAFAREAYVEHLHPFWGKGQMDPTYEKALARGREDLHLYHTRRHLWR